MAANSAVSTDDLIVHLMSMGFDLPDCQDAISFGKISIEAAVEWLVAGKPGFKQQSSAEQEKPSLKLRGQTSTFDTQSSAFSKPVPIPEPTPADVSTAPSPSEGADPSADPTDAAVVSRLHLSDNQRKQKDGFEQKKRDEAKKKAMLEKKRQKEDHARVLKEIAADREKKKLLQGRNKPETESAPPPIKEQKLEPVTPPSESQSPTCLLQIRLPDGRCLRQSFNSTASLQEVWDFIQQKSIPNLSGFSLIQPFPHHEFTNEEMLSSLGDLKLTPSGSLVLQKKQVKQESEGTGQDHMDEEDVVPMDPRQAPTGPTYVPPSPTSHDQPNSRHNWGQGHGLSDENVSANDEGPAEEEGMEEGEPEMVIPGNQLGGGMGNQLGGAIGMGNPLGGAMGMGNPLGGAMGMGNQPPGGMNLPFGFGGGGGMNMPPQGNMMGQGQQVFGGVGQRLVAYDDNQPAPEEAEGLRSLRERALQRAEAQQHHNPSPSTSHPPPTSTVQKLATICLKYITHRLNDPRQAILSLAGISEDMAQIILNYLIKEKQLRPKTLNPFVPCYLRQLILDTYPYATNELLHSIRLHKNLSHLSLSSCQLITDAGFQCLSVLKKLKQLNLSGCKQITNKCSTVLCNLSNLVSLNLEDTGFSDPGVIQYLSSCPEHLTYINLNRTGVTHAILPNLHSGAKQLKQLALEDTQVESLLGVDQLDTLEHLNIGRTKILPESLLCLVKCASLRLLNIANTEKINGDTALQHLQGLQLHTLGLPSRHTTTDAGMQSLTAFNLHSLDLTNYIYVTDEGIQHLGQIRSLRKLLLGNTKLTDTGMVYLGGLTNLEVLDLDRTSITDTGAAIIGVVSISMEGFQIIGCIYLQSYPHQASLS